MRGVIGRQRDREKERKIRKYYRPKEGNKWEGRLRFKWRTRAGWKQLRFQSGKLEREDNQPSRLIRHCSVMESNFVQIAIPCGCGWTMVLVVVVVVDFVRRMEKTKSGPAPTRLYCKLVGQP